jgi:hypothetical protein
MQFCSSNNFLLPVFHTLALWICTILCHLEWYIVLTGANKFWYAVSCEMLYTLMDLKNIKLKTCMLSSHCKIIVPFWWIYCKVDALCKHTWPHNELEADDLDLADHKIPYAFCWIVTAFSSASVLSCVHEGRNVCRGMAKQVEPQLWEVVEALFFV